MTVQWTVIRDGSTERHLSFPNLDTLKNTIDFSLFPVVYKHTELIYTVYNKNRRFQHENLEMQSLRR